MELNGQQENRADNIAAINKLLKKSDGDIANLDKSERAELQRRCTREQIHEMNEIYSGYYPGVKPLLGYLREEPYRRRISTREVAKLLGISYSHYVKVMHGRVGLGGDMAKQLYKRFGLDGNFILENM